MMNKRENRILTIGHSTRSLDELIEVLTCYNVAALVDVRHFPRSKRNPQFNKNNLEIKLPENGIRYYWIEELGGFREGGYEKYMDSEDFNLGVNKLMEIAKQNQTAIMCAEVLWFMCHRSSIASALTKKGWEVIHIYDEKRTQIHKLRKER
jgi:uncharacterized protein (DUF488 family)